MLPATSAIISEKPKSKQGSGSGISYMPQLDSVRAFAVFLVLIEHWQLASGWIKTLPIAMSGVTLFFVLSGFLITQILLSSKENLIKKNTGILHALKQFYARRTLRIFPIYYLTIIVLLIFNIESIREKVLWYLLYASNIYYYIIQNWDGMLSHLWTLAVEEQFYIIWPLIIFLTSKKHLLKVILIVTAIGPLSRILLFMISDGTENAAMLLIVLTPTCMDCFGLGALLAYYRLYMDKKFEFKKMTYVLATITGILMIVLVFMTDLILAGITVTRFSLSVISLMLITKVSIGYKGFLKSIFQNKTLMYLGKISYGMYIYHNFIPSIYKLMRLPELPGIYLKFIVMLVILIALSSLSWFIIEKPINSLKRYFAYN